MFLFPSDLRVSDADREEAVEFLKHHYAAGRLTDRELSERSAAAYRAHYESQLVRLTDDLPFVPEPSPRPARPRVSGLALSLAAVAAAGVAVLAVVPGEVWAPLLTMLFPLAVMLAFTVGPFLLPVVAFVLIARAVAGPHRPARAQLPPHRGVGPFLIWNPMDTRRRR